MFIATLFIVTTNWKQPKFPSTVEWIYKSWYRRTMEYCTCNMDESHSTEQDTRVHIIVTFTRSFKKTKVTYGDQGQDRVYLCAGGT